MTHRFAIRFITLTLLSLHFFEAKAVLTTPLQAAPSDGSIGNPPNALLDWSAVTGANSYQYAIDADPSLANADTVTIALFSQANAVDLLFGTTYYWTVRALSSTPSDSSAWSTVWTFTTLDQVNLTAPLDGAANQPLDVLLDWASVQGITNYDYELDTVNTFNSPVYYYGSVTAASQVYTSNLLFGATYYWRVRARHSADTTQWSASRMFKTVNTVALMAPVQGAVNVPPDVLLDWSVVSGAGDYEYQYDTVPDFTSTVLFSAFTGNVSQANASNLYFSTLYYWRARALHSTDTSDWSTVRTFTTTDLITQVAPVTGALNVPADVLLDWTPLSGIASYEFQYDTTADFNSPYFYTGNTGNVSQVNAVQLLFGTTYHWRVRGMHATDTTSWSTVRTFTTTDTLYLTAPVPGAVNVTPDVLLDWSPLSGITGYEYEFDTLPDFSSPVNRTGTVGNTSQYSTFELFYGRTYYWHVRAFHSYDTTSWSAVRSFTTGSYVNLLSPIDGAVGSSLNPLLDWSSLSGSSGYEYRYDTDSTFSAAVTGIVQSVSQTNLSSLQYGTTYFWQVRPFHPVDTGDWNTMFRFTTVYQLTIPPTLVSPLDATVNIQTTGTSLVWNPLPSVTGYECEFADNPNFQNSTLLSVTATTCNTGLLNQNTTYYWRVHATNGSGFSPWSGVWSFTTVNTTGILPPSTTADKWFVYPNPATTDLFILCTAEAGDLEICDISGRTVVRKPVAAREMNIDIRSLPPGIYFLRLFSENGSRVMTFEKR
ncbi:MAG: hypothetical protein RL213_1017 [Bacteroidota bacterium]|jgi:hypothetical protein